MKLFLFDNGICISFYNDVLSMVEHFSAHLHIHSTDVIISVRITGDICLKILMAMVHYENMPI